MVKFSFHSLYLQWLQKLHHFLGTPLIVSTDSEIWRDVSLQALGSCMSSDYFIRLWTKPIKTSSVWKANELPCRWNFQGSKTCSGQPLLLSLLKCLLQLVIYQHHGAAFSNTASLSMSTYPCNKFSPFLCLILWIINLSMWPLGVPSSS